MDTDAVIAIIKQNIKRCMADKFPDYPHDVAIYNDLLRQVAPQKALTIEYNGNDCKILHEPIFVPGFKPERIFNLST